MAEYDPVEAALIEQAASDAHNLLRADGAMMRSITKTIKSGNEWFTLRLGLNESVVSTEMQADAWMLVYEKLLSMGMSKDYDGRSGIEAVMDFLDELEQRTGG